MININSMQNEQYYSIDEVSQTLKVAYLTVYRWIQAEKLRAVKVGKQYRISKKDLDKYLLRDGSSKSKINNFIDTVAAVRKHKESGRTVAFISGCFDLLHMGHVELFRFAKSTADILVIGLENDDSIRATKGSKRPVNNLDFRCHTMAELESVDLVFPIEQVISFDAENANEVHEQILSELKPTYLVTTSVADRFEDIKRERADRYGVTFLPMEKKQSISSTEIIEKILEELK